MLLCILSIVHLDLVVEACCLVLTLGTFASFLTFAMCHIRYKALLEENRELLNDYRKVKEANDGATSNIKALNQYDLTPARTVTLVSTRNVLLPLRTLRCYPSSY